MSKRRLVTGTAHLEHDPEKWEPVFGKRSCSNNNLERDDDSKKSHPVLGAASPPMPPLCSNRWGSVRLGIQSLMARVVATGVAAIRTAQVVAMTNTPLDRAVGHCPRAETDFLAAHTTEPERVPGMIVEQPHFSGARPFVASARLGIELDCRSERRLACDRPLKRSGDFAVVSGAVVDVGRRRDCGAFVEADAVGNPRGCQAEGQNDCAHHPTYPHFACHDGSSYRASESRGGQPNLEVPLL